MSRILLGTICGLTFGMIDVLVMIPLKYESKRKMAEAMSAAIITRAYVPIIGIGIVGGVIIGLMV